MHSSALTGLVVAFACVASACTPSSNTGRQPAVGGDSAPEAPREPGSASEPVVESEPPPEVAPEPPLIAQTPSRPRVAQPILVPRSAGPYRVRLVDASHRDLPIFAHGGRTYVMGTVGERYSIVISNPTEQRVEAVISVDGLDAMDGQAANFVTKRGYILDANNDLTVDGFRTSMDEVATFRFSSVADSYAGRLGQARDVGVIGVAFFKERSLPEEWPPVAADKHYREPARRAAARPSFHAPPAPVAPPSTPPASTAPAATPKDIARGGGASGAQPSPEERRGLGTEFGEARESHIGGTSFDRASASVPAQVVSVRYNDRAGLVAIGIAIPPVYVDADLHLRETADPFRQNRFAQAPPPRY